MNQVKSLEEVSEFFKLNDNFAILTHRYPDGDTLGSAYALCGMLQQKGKKAKVLVNGELQKKYYYLKKGIEKYEFEIENIVSVDVADEKLLGELIVYKDKIKLAIDHHETHKPFADIYYVEGDSASNCEIIFELAKVMKIDFTRNICNAIYTGISTDTGCFRYSNVTVRTHIITAQLMEYGCDSYEINKAMFETVSKNKKALEAFVIENMEYYHNEEVAIAYTTREILKKFELDNETMGNISHIPRTIEGVKVGITLKETDDETFKISIRTNDGINASEICKNFDGGGHNAAAGCTIKGTMEQVKEKILPVVYKYL